MSEVAVLNVVGQVESNALVIVSLPANTWTWVPKSPSPPSPPPPMRIAVTVNSSRDLFLVTCSYRRVMSVLQIHSDSRAAIRVYDAADGSLVKNYNVDGFSVCDAANAPVTELTGTNTLNGAAIIAGLAGPYPKSYNFELWDFTDVAANRSYNGYRQLLVYQVRATA